MVVRMKRRDVSKKRAGFIVCFIFVATVCVFANCGRVVLSRQIVKASKQNEAVSRQYESEKERTEELNRLKIDSKTKQFIENTARDKFGLVYKNEVIFEPKNGKATSEDK